MGVRTTKYYGKAKDSTTDKINHINKRIGNIKNRIFNMNLPHNVEIALRNRMRTVSVFLGLLALVSMFFMSQSRLYLITALLAGFIAMIIDFIVEYHGISQKAWDYPTKHISFRKVPIEVPFMFFSCGILATFAAYMFSSEAMVSAITDSVIAGISTVQVILLLIATFFIFQYFRRAVKSMIFGILPLGIALYLSFPNPWILVLAILPMYVDYYLEKRLVKSAHLDYDRYSEEVAINVAINYFPSALIMFGIVALLLSVVGGVL